MGEEPILLTGAFICCQQPKPIKANSGNIVKSLEIVMPDLIRHPERIEFTGFRLSPE
ncbi:MAG: hypothetical protein J7M30_05940 [Deltaproteobacteria bacterium]|nr:hypothetical protein [Deltaproteobacteria bacterium]